MSISATALGFRLAEATDVDWLLTLRLATMTAYLEASGASLTRQEQLERVLRDFSCIRIVMREAVAVGMLKLDRSADPWVVIQIQIDPAYQGQGLGTLIIRQLQAEVVARGVGLALSVLKVNPAKALYDRLGFQVIGENGDSYEMRYSA